MISLKDPAALLAALEAAGFTLGRQDDRLTVQPASKLTAEQRAAIVAHKAGLLTLLADRADVEELDRLVCARPPPPSAVAWVGSSAGCDSRPAAGKPSAVAGVTETVGKLF